MEGTLSNLSSLFKRKEDVINSTFPDIIEQWDVQVEKWKDFEGNERYRLLQQKLDLLYEKFDAFLTAKSDVSVFKATKFANDVYSVYYSIECLINPSAKSKFHDEMKPEAKELWNTLIEHKKKCEQDRLNYQNSIQSESKVDDEQISNIQVNDCEVDWYHFSVFLEKYLTSNIAHMNAHLNPFVIADPIQFQYDPLYHLLFKFLLSSHSLAPLADQKMPMDRDSVSTIGSSFSVFSFELEMIYVWDVLAFTRKNDLFKSFAEIILLESKEFAATKSKLIDLYYHMGRFTLELCFLQKTLFFNEFKKLFNSANKESASAGDTRERNIIRTNALRKAAKKQHFERMWLDEVIRLDYERRIRDIFLDKSVEYKLFSLDEKLVAERIGSLDLTMEEFPAMLMTSGNASFEPGIIICTSMMFYFISFAARENKTHISHPYHQLLSVDCYNASRFSPSTIVVQRKDGEIFNFFSIVNIKRAATTVKHFFRDAEQMIEVLGDTAVIKDGFLTKEGANVKNWKKRWFVLYSDRLVYKVAPESSKELGKIPLKNVLGIEKDVLDKHKNPHTFNILTVNRKYIIQCQDAKEQNQWVAALQTTLKRQNLVFPFIHIAVIKKNNRGKLQNRILQFDFLNKRINNLNGDALKKVLPFANLASTKLDPKDDKHIVMLFKNQSRTDYDIYTVIPQHVKLISMIVAQIIENTAISVADVYERVSGLMEKSGFAFEKVKAKRSGSIFSRGKSAEASVKRWIVLQAGQIVVYNGSCDGYPAYCECLYDSTVTTSENKEEMVITNKSGSRRFEFSSMNECEEWVKLAQRYSSERTENEFFVEIVTLQRSESMISPTITINDQEDDDVISQSPSSSSLAYHKSVNKRRTMSHRPQRTSNATNGPTKSGSFMASPRKSEEDVEQTQLEEDDAPNGDEEYDEDEDAEMPMIVSSTLDLGLDKGDLAESTTKKFEILKSTQHVERALAKGDPQPREARISDDLTAFEWKTSVATSFEIILLVDVVDVYKGYPVRPSLEETSLLTSSDDSGQLDSTPEDTEETFVPSAFSIVTYQSIETVICDNDQIRDLFVEILSSLALF